MEAICAMLVNVCFTNQLSKVLCIALQWITDSTHGNHWIYNTNNVQISHFVWYVMQSIHCKSFEVEIRGEKLKQWGEETDGAKFIDDCFNIRRRTAEFHSRMISLCLGPPI